MYFRITKYLMHYVHFKNNKIIHNKFHYFNIFYILKCIYIIYLYFKNTFNRLNYKLIIISLSHYFKNRYIFLILKPGLSIQMQELESLNSITPILAMDFSKLSAIEKQNSKEHKIPNKLKKRLLSWQAYWFPDQPINIHEQKSNLIHHQGVQSSTSDGHTFKTLYDHPKQKCCWILLH